MTTVHALEDINLKVCIQTGIMDTDRKKDGYRNHSADSELVSWTDAKDEGGSYSIKCWEITKHKK